MKKLFIKTWGCQMNEYDSRRMAGILAPLGFVRVDTIDDADMIILNTCHIREKATEKLFSDLGRIKPFKNARDGIILAVGGCVAQAQGELIMKRAPYVDIVFGPQTWHLLPQMVDSATKDRRVISTEFATQEKFDNVPVEHSPAGASAFLSVQEGCDRFCTFCVVPYTRGAQYSRDMDGIIDEANRLIDAGAKEITLLGQNVNDYETKGKDGKTLRLSGLIEKLADIDGLKRIRYMTSHPLDMSDDLIDAHGDCDKLMPFLHLPVQSGSDKILKAMNRKHKASLYLDIMSKLKKKRPDIAISGDFIVAFPGESDQDFEDTMQIVRDVGYASAYSFVYSPRPGTPAAAMGGMVEKEAAFERLERLQNLISSQHADFNKSAVGKTMPVLFDRKGKKDGQLLGRSPYFHSVHSITDKPLFGEIVDVKITSARGGSVSGNVIS